MEGKVGWKRGGRYYPENHRSHGKQPDITQKELAAVIGITEDGVKYHIISLRKKGVIKRINPEKGRYWEIVGLGGTP